MIDGVALRPVVASDEAFLRRVYRSTREAELDFVDWDDTQKDAFVDAQFDAQRSYYEQYYAGASFDVILVDGQPAGRLYVARWADEIRIVDIALVPEYRDRGVGSALLRALLDEGASSRRRVTIHVERFNRALALYDRLGFTLAEDKGVYLFLAWSPPIPSCG